ADRRGESRTREPSKASSECAAHVIHDRECVNVSRSPAEPVEGGRQQGGARHGMYSESRAPSLALVPSSQTPGIAVIVSNASVCNQYCVCTIYSIHSNTPV